MMQARSEQGKRGFTLVEISVVLALAAIIAAVSIPSLVSWYRTYKSTERQANAELIYTIAQNDMQQLKADGRLDDVQGSTTAVTDQRVTLASATGNIDDKGTSASAQSKSSDIITLSSDDPTAASALKLIAPDVADQLSRVGFSSMAQPTGAHYRIEINPKAGYVYRVYFSEEPFTRDDILKNDTTPEGAKKQSDLDDSELAQHGIAVYGDTVPATFESKEKKPACWVGYFEFSGDSSNAGVTGGYFYQVFDDYTMSASATDRLHNANEIDAGAVDSTDGTAYGVLVPKSRVDSGTFVAPTDYSKRYDVTLAGQLGVESMEADCYFYKADVPASTNDYDTGWAPYTIEYYVDGQLAQSETRWGTNYQWISLSQDDLYAGLPGFIRGLLVWLGSYQLDAGNSTLTGTVQPDGSLTLKVRYTTQGGSHSALPSGDDLHQTSLANGTGTWYPWSTAANDQLNGRAFYLNENFAGCITAGSTTPSVDTYQVRTDDQLQHIGSPYGSTYQQPMTSYLGDTFYQTHDITIDQTWYPIGQSSAKRADDTKFAGAFYGGYAARDSEDHSNLQPPTADSQTFTITLAKRTGETDEARANALFSTNPAYETDDTYRSYGVFGYVTGTIGYAKLSVGRDDTGFDLRESFDTPHYGTLAGDVTGGGSIDHSSVSIPKSSSMRIGQGNAAENYRTTDDAIVGGLCGYLGGDASVTDSSLTLEDNNAAETEPRLELAATPRENIGKSVSVGGLVGRASCDKEAFLSNCSVELGDDAALSAQGNTSGGRQVSAGGLVGYVRAGNQASIADCSVKTNGTLSVGTPDSNAAWNNESYIGGFAGYVEGGAGILRPSLTSDTEDKSSVVVTAKANGTQAAAGGMFGYLHNASFDTAKLTLGSDLTVTATSTNTEGLAGGLVGWSANDDTSSTLKDGTLTVGGNATVSSANSYTAYAGGMIGRLTGSSLTNAAETVNGEGKALTVIAQGAHAAAEAGGVVGNLESSSAINTPKLEARALNVTASEDDGRSAAGGLIGHATRGDLSSSDITNATITVNGDADIESAAAKDYALSGMLAGQLESVGVNGTTANVMGSLTANATDRNGASARAAGFIAQFENGPALNKASLTVGRDLSATASSNGGAALTGGLVAYASSDPSSLQVADASLAVTGNVDAHSHANNAGQDSFSGGLAGQLKSVGFDGPSVTVGGSLTSLTESPNGAAYAGGLVGDARGASLSSVKPSLHGTSATATSSNGSSFAGGLVGHDASTPIADSSLSPAGDISVSSSSANSESHSGGYVGDIESASVSDTTLSPTGTISVRAADANQAAYAGGFAGDSHSTALSNIALTANGSQNVQAESNAETFAAGLVGQASSSNADSATLAATGDISLAAQSNYAESHSGGLFGLTNSSTTVSDAAFRPSANVAIEGTSNGNAYAAGLIGKAESSTFHYLSLLESDNEQAAMVSVSGSGSSASVAGGFGHVTDSNIDNSYVVNRNAQLVLDNKSNSGTSYTGGFAGSVTTNSNDRNYSITTSYVNAPISCSSPTLAGFVDHTATSNDNLRFTSDFVIESISGNTPANEIAAFIRSVSCVNGLRGDYAVVTDSAEATPYKFAIEGDLNAANGTERCFVYRADMTELVDEKFDQKDGAHPASYAYLTQTNNPEVTVPWNKSLKTSNILDFLGTVDKPGITARYGFVTKDSAVSMLRDGDNPFPTATRDKGGNYVNYGKWIPAPAAPVQNTTAADTNQPAAEEEAESNE